MLPLRVRGLLNSAASTYDRSPRYGSGTSNIGGRALTLDAIIAANRFGLGARPGELADIGADARAWLNEQITGQRPIPPEMAGLTTSVTAFQTLAKIEQQRREQKAAAAEGM